MENKELILEIDNNINDIIDVLLEFEQIDDKTVIWDLTKDKIKKTTNRLKTSEQIKIFLIKFFNKSKNLPKNIKSKLLKYVLGLLIGISSVATIEDIVNSEVPEVKNVLNQIVDSKKKESGVSDKTIEKKSEKEEVSKEKDYITPKKASDSLVDFLKYEEGSIINKGAPVLKAYSIGDGAVTVGWGHATKTKDSKIKIGDKITKEQAESFLKSDIKWAEDRLNAIIKNWEEEGIETNITQSMYDAMVSLIYNMGIGNFRNKIGKNFLNYVKTGNIHKAKEEILNMSSNLYKRYPGIKKRREKEADMFFPENQKEYNSETLSESYKKRMKKLAGII